MKKPEFNDEFAKTIRRNHKTFDGTVITILYGAKDAEGNPCQPREDADDGHGRWFGIEVNGDYTMFSWTHSKDEGGNTEYGTSHGDHALEDMEDGIRKKRDLAHEAEILARGEDNGDIESAMESLKNEWNEFDDFGTPVEKDLQKRFDEALAEYGPRVEKMKQNNTAKAELVTKAEALKDASNYRDARNQLRDLRNELRNIGTAGEEADRKFMHELNEIDGVLREKQQEYRDNLDAHRAEAKEKKEDILARTKEAITNVSNWKEAGAKLNSLFEEWKAAGSAGHDDDEDLWKKFNELRHQFRDDRQKFFDERSKQWEASIAKKKELITEAKNISDQQDYGRTNTERMKELDKEWRAAGYSGKDQNDALWDEFNKAKEVFWDAKKNNAFKRVQTGIDNKKSQLADIKKKIEDLEFRMTIAPNPAMKDDIENELYLRKSEEEKLEAEIEDDEKKFQD